MQSSEPAVNALQDCTCKRYIKALLTQLLNLTVTLTKTLLELPKKHNINSKASLFLLPNFCLINVNNQQNSTFSSPLDYISVHFLGPRCLAIFLTSASLSHLPSSLSPCGYLWPGMCRADRRARARVMCGCRRPPSPIAPADITDNYSITTVKTRRCHTQSRSA